MESNLALRARIIQAIRRFFIDRDFLEVETPCRIPAPAPEAHIRAPASGDWYLQTSPELCMKRLLAAGIPRLFQICKCFRQGERGQRHLPEFTLLEWYAAHAGYRDMMQQTEDMICFVAGEIDHGIVYNSRHVDLSPEWPRLTVAEAFSRHGQMPSDQALAEDRYDEIMGLVIEPRLGLDRPVFVYDYPAARSALARLRPGNPAVAERFELYIAGIELCNAFTELTDPAEQRLRFEQARREMGENKGPVYPMPERFLEALAYMPPCAGNALGIDRLVMLFAGAERIDDIVTFTPEQL